MKNTNNNQLNQTEVKTRAKKFINELGIPITNFTKNISVSVSAYNRWLRDDLILSESTIKRISDYLKRYNF